MRYIPWGDNLAQSTLSTISSSSETAGFEDTFAQNEYPSEAWLSTTGTPGLQHLEWDFGQARSFDIFVLSGHNLTADADIIVKRGTTANPVTVVSTMTYREFDAYMRLSTSESYRYVRLEFADTANGDDYIRIGTAWIGELSSTPQQFSQEWADDRRQVARQQLTEGGNVIGERLIEQVTMPLHFEGLSKTDYDDIWNGWIRECKGPEDPCFVIPKDTESEGYMMHIIEHRSNRSGHTHFIDMTLLEAGRGVTEGD
jgi:hypothetical protein